MSDDRLENLVFAEAQSSHQSDQHFQETGEAFDPSSDDWPDQARGVEAGSSSAFGYEEEAEADHCT